MTRSAIRRGGGVRDAPALEFVSYPLGGVVSVVVLKGLYDVPLVLVLFRTVTSVRGQRGVSLVRVRVSSGKGGDVEWGPRGGVSVATIDVEF